jgi:hypothetical protein
MAISMAIPLTLTLSRRERGSSGNLSRREMGAE